MTRARAAAGAASRLSPEEVGAAWRAAIAFWEAEVRLAPPEQPTLLRPYRGDDPLAYIDLAERRVVVDLRQLAALRIPHTLTAVLAHEIGHHIRFPHTLKLAAELETIEAQLVPLLGQSLVNLFFDLQVNEVVGHTYLSDLADVYRAFAARDAAKMDPLFTFYLACYEELWSLVPGSLVPAARTQAMEHDHPGWRSDARIFVQTFYPLDDVYLQFVYFLSVFIRFVPDPTKLIFRIPLAGDLPRPGQDDFDRAGEGHGQMERALEEALRRGMITKAEAERALETAEPQPVKRVSTHQPGVGGSGFRRSKQGEAYRKLVERYLIEPPPSEVPPEPSLPSLTRAWEPGESPRAIDWIASVVAHGSLAPVSPLARELLPDEPALRERGLPAMEIYLDTSGSMPSANQINAMTLAAQVLSASVLRKGGMVRGVVYSWECIVSDWMRNEDAAREFFLNFQGGGTAFPFAVLRRLSREPVRAIRVVVSDSDFLWNVAAGIDDVHRKLQDERAKSRPGPRSADPLELAIARSAMIVFMLAIPKSGAAQVKQTLGKYLCRPNARLVTVEDVSKLAPASAALARAILG